MKKITVTLVMVLFLLSGVFFSCQKELSCDWCTSNKPPIARSGNDTVIVLPTDSVVLNGSASSDADGSITAWKWTKISGPVSFAITNNTVSVTRVNALVEGIYQFELQVTDNGGLSAKDTVQITVNKAVFVNHPPIANAGNDTTITLPANTANLDGSKSTDPDNNIVSYTWTKISGPASFAITNPNAMQTQVTTLVEGVYLFDLKVTDAGGLFDKDTVQVIVMPEPPPSTCTPLNRPIINAQLIPFGTLSEARTGISTASAGNKILFAGGVTTSGQPSSVVDVYNIATQTWTTAQLSLPRFEIAAISAANKIYFAGGFTASAVLSSRIDIYDVASNSWSTAELSEPRARISAATIGDKIMFAGGWNKTNCGSRVSDRVDIYNLSTNTWTISTLSVARVGLSATTAGNKIYFAGGGDFFTGYGVYDMIDIYDDVSNTWTTSVLNERKSHHGAIAVGNYIYWAGGAMWDNVNDYTTTCNVERRDLTNGTSTELHLFQPSPDFGACTFGGSRTDAFLRNGSIVFFSGYRQFDIYDPVSGLWSIGNMTNDLIGAGVISVNNIIYVAGGGCVPAFPLSNQVWKLEF